MAEITRATSPADIKKRIVARYKAGRNNRQLARIVEKANIMANLAGQFSAVDEL
jgi:hypothetical protein